MAHAYTTSLAKHARKVEDMLPASGVRDTIEALRKEMVRLAKENAMLWRETIERDGDY
jgi:hypothetical protein